ncbi:MAP7 domain-containing protein 3 isoform X2 [Dipodomys merriami]|uniref:MAP7 domain-containing protein 3 isoform X2 n=1 Tax=Dipodomys merriami TaxID=94247 RepID=UPI0038560246
MPKYKPRRQSTSSSSAAPPGNSPIQPQGKAQPPHLRPTPPGVTPAPAVAGPSTNPTTADPSAAATTSDNGNTSLKDLREPEVVSVIPLKNDVKQKLAKQRREEINKQFEANTEKNFLEKERKAKLQFEKWLEIKQQQMKEHKERDEQRRMSVEFNRKLKLEQETERYKAVVNRTLERTSRMDHQVKRSSWDGSIINTDKSEHKKNLFVCGKENKPHSCVDKEGTEDKQATGKYVLRYVHVPLLNITDEELKASMVVRKSAIQNPLQPMAEEPEKDKVETPPETTIEETPSSRAEVTPEIEATLSSQAELTPEVKVDVPTISTEPQPMKPELTHQPLTPIIRKRPSSSIPGYIWPSSVTRWPSASPGNTSHLAMVPTTTSKFAQAAQTYKLASFRHNSIVPPAVLKKRRDTMYKPANKSETVNQQLMSSEDSHNRRSSRSPSMDATTTSAKKQQGEKRRSLPSAVVPRKDSTMEESSAEQAESSKLEKPQKSKMKTKKGRKVTRETSSSNSSEDEADGKKELEKDNLSPSEKLDMYYRDMVKPQKLLFLQAETGELQEGRKVYFHKYVTTFGEKGTKIEFLAKPSTSRPSTRRLSTFVAKTGNEMNDIARSLLNTNMSRWRDSQLIDLNYPTESPILNSVMNSYKYNLKDHTSPQLSFQISLLYKNKGIVPQTYVHKTSFSHLGQQKGEPSSSLPGAVYEEEEDNEN